MNFIHIKCHTLKYLHIAAKVYCIFIRNFIQSFSLIFMPMIFLTYYHYVGKVSALCNYFEALYNILEWNAIFCKTVWLHICLARQTWICIYGIHYSVRIYNTGGNMKVAFTFSRIMVESQILIFHRRRIWMLKRFDCCKLFICQLLLRVNIYEIYNIEMFDIKLKRFSIFFVLCYSFILNNWGCSWYFLKR